MARSEDLGRPDVTVDRDGTARRGADPGFLLRALRVLGLAALVALGVLLLLRGSEAFLLAFAGVLIAILLRAPSDWLAGHTPLSPRWALALVVLAVVAVLALVAWLTVPSLISQAGQFIDQAARMIQNARQWVQQVGGQRLDVTLDRLLPSAEAVFGRGPGGLVTTTFGVLASALVVIVVGLYGAANPGVYRDGFVRLFPPERRPRIAGVVDEIGRMLGRWLVGQLVSMASVGVLVYIGLLVLGVPLALGLAVATALLEFIPYLGPILGAVPALLVALGQGTSTALWVLLLYAAVQTLESYLITPLVQERAVYLPPALIILVQVLMGLLFGILGVFLATPLAAAALVAVKRLYIEAALGDDADRGA